MAKCIARHGLRALLIGLDGKREVSWGGQGMQRENIGDTYDYNTL